MSEPRASAAVGCCCEGGRAPVTVPAAPVRVSGNALPGPDHGVPVPLCPVCRRPGKPVGVQTVKAMLSASLMALRPVLYFFCDTRDCPLVYFSADGGQSFTKGQVREIVYQKAPDEAGTLVCYCFRHTVGEIRQQAAGGSTEAVDEIRAGTSAGLCACDIRNPQGSCCLGNAARVVREMGAA